MFKEIDLFHIVFLVWFSTLTLAGFYVYKNYTQKTKTPQEETTELVRTLSEPAALHKEWNVKKQKIKTDHRELMQAQRRRMREHRQRMSQLSHRN